MRTGRQSSFFMKKILFISSEGGHLQELLQLESLKKDYDCRYITEKTASTLFLQERYPGKTDYLVYGTQDHLLPYLFIFPFNILRSFFLFLKYRPDCVITTGTHTAVPMCYIAHLFGKKVIYIETFANRHSPTKAGRMVYKIADLFVVQWEEMKEFYPKAVCWGWLF